MKQPGQFRLIPKEVSAIQRNGTLHRDLEIAEWMERSQPFGEYRAGAGAFVVATPTGDLLVGPDDWIIRCAGRFLPCPDQVFSVIATGAEMSEPSLCSECCDAVPPAELSRILSSGAWLCADCLQEYQLLLEVQEPPAELDRNHLLLRPEPQAVRP
jgi:hypothetical protein